jgi:hypothetical protein
MRTDAQGFPSRNMPVTGGSYALSMLRTIRQIPSLLADYTFGTVIVLAQLAFAGRGTIEGT